MGRRKIDIEPIADEKTRTITFQKRRMGLMKKAMELSILCNCDVTLGVESEEGKIHIFSSKDSVDSQRNFVNRIFLNEEPSEVKYISDIQKVVKVQKEKEKIRERKKRAKTKKRKRQPQKSYDEDEEYENGRTKKKAKRVYESEEEEIEEKIIQIPVETKKVHNTRSKSAKAKLNKKKKAVIKKDIEYKSAAYKEQTKENNQRIESQRTMGFDFNRNLPPPHLNLPPQESSYGFNPYHQIQSPPGMVPGMVFPQQPDMRSIKLSPSYFPGNQAISPLNGLTLNPHQYHHSFPTPSNTMIPPTNANNFQSGLKKKGEFKNEKKDINNLNIKEEKSSENDYQGLKIDVNHPGLNRTPHSGFTPGMGSGMHIVSPPYLSENFSTLDSQEPESPKNSLMLPRFNSIKKIN